MRLPKSTVARLLATLEDVDAVERFDGVRWRIGPGVAALTAAGSPERNLIAIAHPFLVDLVAELGEDAGLGLPDGNEVHYVDQVESDNPVQVRDWTGTRAPMHAVPSGLVLLAEWPDDALDAYLGGELVALTRRTVTDPEAAASAAGRGAGAPATHGASRSSPRGSTPSPLRSATRAGNAIAAHPRPRPAYRFPASREDSRVSEIVVTAANAIAV